MNSTMDGRKYLRIELRQVIYYTDVWRNVLEVTNIILSKKKPY
jgi:hypothetical protein